MFVTPPNKRLRRRLREQVDAHDETKPGNVATMELPKCEVLDREPCVPTTSRTKEENIHDQLQKNATPYKSVIEGSRASSRSKRSTASSTAKRKQLELEAAEAKAKIQLLLIDKRLEADLAKIEAEEEESDEDKSTTTIDDHRRSQVEEWLNHSQQAGPAGATSRPPSPPPPPASAPPAPAPAAPAAGVPAAARHAPVQHQDQSLSSIRQLALELKNMMVSSPAPPDERLLSRLSTPRDLPSFGGDCIEWLHFKTAYDESTRVCQFSDSENLWRLRKALRGEALEAVTDLLIGNTPPGVVMESLQLSCDAPVCDVDDCGLAHHRLLHWKKPGSADDIDPSSMSPPPPPPPRDTVAHVASSSDVSATSSGDVMLKVVKVKLCGPNGDVCTYALLDDAASVSLIDSELANQLGLEGQQSSAVKFIDAFGLEVYQSDAPKVCTSISGQDNDNSYDITLRKVSKLNLPMQNLSVVNNITSEHLLHLKNDVCNENVVPRLLIGEDNYFLLAPLDVIHGNKDEPYATRCRLGWSIHGYCGRSHYNTHFQKDTGYAEHYRKEVHKLFEDGYARELTEDELAADQVWYLPHFGVQNPNKPGKLRLVFDAAGKVKGTCLNDYLLTGPDLYNSLLGIMYRFRENKIVITGDIKDMFLRINIRSEDQNVLRFLWQEPPPPAPPAPPGPRAPTTPTQSPLKICTMQSLIFGATCSPFIAQYIKNKNALKYEDLYPEAVQAIIKNHYMDDCLYSCDSAETAINLVNQITTIHKYGGFEIRRWSSNCKQVLDNIPSDALAQTAIQMKDGATNMSERTLGLIWHPAEDCFAFKVSFSRVSQEVLDGTTPPTKAKMLGLIMSIYDIHGFLSPFIIKSKVILQDVHRSGIDWNCHIQAKEFSSWCKWLDELKLLESIRIPRWYLSDDNWTECYSVTEPELCDKKIVNNTQMHIFCDASIKAYATVIFWRFTRFDGRVKVCFVGSKCRVTPLRPVSIPRLELQAALLAARLAHTVQTEHKDIQPNQRFFWTDSSTVLQWLRSDPRSYKPYVAHRLGELDELAAPAEWRHVPSRLNAADVATRPDAPPLALTDAWFQGPAFLRRPEEEWPKDLKTCKIVDEAACEERNINLVVSRDTSVAPDALRLPNENNISKWTTLLRSTARILLLFRRPKGDYCLDVDLMRKAETLVLRKSQQDAFGQEIECLRNNKPLPSNSRLIKLTSYLDDDGLLRVEGRIDKVTGVSTSTTRPAILDGKHRVAQLLVEHEHRRALHGAHEHVVNELRQRYWVVKLRSAVRAAAARCLLCRRRRAAPAAQRMGPLPAARLQHHRRPFSCTGIDYFGPMEITVGRKRQKVYGVLFTCLTIRAIHIELAESLTTDSTIMALRRMIGRRSTPSVIWSDNGTNLRGCDAELRQSIRELNTEKLREDGLSRGIEWRFIPPGAPEMGGAWERMIRTVKTALKVALKERAPHRETLSTLLVEVEALVNSRPITHVSTDPNYPEALTPNHFLIGTSSNGPAFGKYDDGDLCLRKQWRIAQRLADMFWSRWIKEYLPTLLPRQKWQTDERALRVGDYVVLVDTKVDRGCWRHGVVSAAHAGADGRVRVVDVRTRAGVLRRPATRVALLSPIDS
ncbi:uncharacterized protein LOC119693943 [Plutella xylostella]|uniref:uncharacterized protein LOC119693943 n=1 Tax=Plutella xylostella TaxID=51655 RepID=UPI002032DA4C|nr:uncharacterized protein LOC119693943 [Plutella xylostella]